MKDISTVVLCTGYLPNLDIIEEDLQYDDEGEWEVSKGWTMENNALTISVGNPTPSKSSMLVPPATPTCTEAC